MKSGLGVLHGLALRPSKKSEKIAAEGPLQQNFVSERTKRDFVRAERSLYGYARAPQVEGFQIVFRELTRCGYEPAFIVERRAALLGLDTLRSARGASETCWAAVRELENHKA